MSPLSTTEVRLPASRRAGRFGLAALALVAALVLGGCNFSPTFGAARGVTSQGQETFRLWQGMVIAGLIVAVFVWGLIFWALIKYRRRKGDTQIPRQFQEHIPLEIFYTVVPVLMVAVIFGFTVVVENSVDNVSHRPAAVVNVTGYQWGWIFQYANSGGVTIETSKKSAPSALPRSYTSPLYPQLVLPEGETTRIFLRSNDVIHGFYVHAFNFSRYAQPGIVNEFEVTPVTTGVFNGQCTQYCGLYHAEMLFSVKVVTPGQYQAWLSNQEKLLQNRAA